MSPVLVPAFPAVLRRGLPLVWRRDDGSASEPLLCMEAPRGGSTELWTENSYGGHCYADVEHESAEDYWLDLRDPAVRDAVVRAIWRKLHSDESEPLTAPGFEFDDDTDNYYLLDDHTIIGSWQARFLDGSAADEARQDEMK